jgi:hypothetical protein
VCDIIYRYTYVAGLTTTAMELSDNEMMSTEHFMEDLPGSTGLLFHKVAYSRYEISSGML